MLIDTHVHLNDLKLYSRLDEVIKDAIKNGVSKMIVSGYDYHSSKLALDIADQYENIYASIGVHPSEIKNLESDDLSWIETMAKSEKVIAIGEIGLDYYWDQEHKDKQIEFFHKQLQIATKLNYPVVIHSRKAAYDTYEVLKNYELQGVMHCYPYSYEMAQKFIGLGFVLGIGGVVTFKNASLREVVKAVSLDKIVTETDAPYLTPTPYRGKLNEPKYLHFIVSEIANLKNIDESTVIDTISKTVKKIFNI